MKCTVVFLVLSLVVLMAETTEGFWFHLARYVLGQKDAQKMEKQMEQQQEQLHKRGVDDNPQQPYFD